MAFSILQAVAISDEVVEGASAEEADEVVTVVGAEEAGIVAVEVVEEDSSLVSRVERKSLS